MIHTQIDSKEAKLLQKKYPALAKSMKWIKEEAGKLEDGNYPLGDGMVGMVQSYQTRPLDQSKFESHRANVDLQYVMAGREIMGWLHINDLSPKTEFDEAKDVILYHVPENYHQMTLTATNLALLFPEDGHMPKLMVSNPEDVKKVVVKIPIELLEG
ncbi:MAG: YhcH/YjgK/YiaL family protein [Cyclobacteriaceae bacterium]|nr:YhcH/YjgK/YiaL family protein [Cyclobacteriaceae bacterium SS2]|tara:strand:- start:648 stop:1118 length:471 start_codon:yes stop_codon:yes gene_type:complete